MLRNFVGYRIRLCKELNLKMNKNNIIGKGCFRENMVNKSNFDILLSEINILNSKLKYWIGDVSFENAEDLFQKKIQLKSIKVKAFDFLNTNEIEELVSFDLGFTKDKNICKFEKEFLIKKKNKCLNDLDIKNAVLYVKLIDDINKKIDKIDLDIKNIEHIYNNKISSYENVYHQFVSEMSSDNINLEEVYNNTNYNQTIVIRYRLNKICKMIINYCNTNDLYEVFENQEIKNLLGKDYFRIKQMVNEYVGADSKFSD